MSSETETDAGVLEGVSVLEPFQRYYHIPALVLLVGLMLWLRILPAENFIRADGIYFSGNDAWYHFRETSYVVHNWPFTMPFDPWTQYPYGVSNSQFGTLYDQLVGTAALIVGLGSPTKREIATTLLYAPAVFGAATAIPVYFIGKRFVGRFGAIFGVAVLAFLPGVFLRRTTAGFADHHAAEVFFHAIAVLAFLAALRVAETEKPIYELVVDRDWDALEKPTKYGALAGVAMALYVWVWPPAIVLIGIIGVFYLLTLGVKFGLGDSPDHIAYVGVVAMGVLSLFMLIRFDEFGFSASAISMLHILLSFGVAAGAGFMVWLARQWEDLPFARGLYPVSTISIALVGVAILSLIAPGAWENIQNNLFRTLAIGQTDTTLTIGEAQARPAMGPQYLSRLSNFLVGLYGLTFLTAFTGLGAVVYDGINERGRAEHLFVVVWTVFLFMMAITQVRFHYYFVLPIAVLNAYFVGTMLRAVNVDSDFELTDVKTYHVSVMLAVVILVLAPIAPFGGISMTSQTVYAQMNGDPANPNDIGPRPGAVTAWDDTTDWLQNGTPEIESMEQYGTYEKTDDFEYPGDSYGVMSWWDYGHWITVRGERMPHANPFQAGARTASRYFQATNETEANLLLDALPSLGPRVPDIDSYSNEDLRELIDEQSDQQAEEDVRYVTIDWQMATGKFGAIARWSGPGQSAYFNRSSDRVQAGGQNHTVQYSTFNDRYEETMVSRLYWDNAAGLEHYRLVHTSQQRKLLVTYSQINPQTGQVRGQQFLRSIGNVGANRTFQTFFALQQREDFALHEFRQAESVKTFERVEGATLTGSAPAGANVSVSLRLNNTQTGENFTYEQTVRADDDGTFAVTVPYATNDEVSPSEGGTDSVIEADGRYTVNVEDGGITTMRVPESAVLEGETLEVEFSAGNASVRDSSETTVGSTGAVGDSSLSATDLASVQYDVLVGFDRAVGLVPLDVDARVESEV